MMVDLSRAVTVVAVLLAMLCASVAAEQPAITPVQFTKETLPNGLRVIYVPLKETPVVHVRVLYHVGSRDERPDRQGFAHMFEHMMFRGSAHVAPEQHMKLIGVVGGYSNAFTSFDQTTYINTVPANHLEMALYLEADRMASFKVSEDIYKIERNVVAKEWGIRQNRPYGTMFEDFLSTAFTQHSYRWTPIGNMDHLKAAAVSELQEFFNTYYVPNNAVLVIAGNFEQAKARELVNKFYAWIPRGEDVKRQIPQEPQQSAAKLNEVKRVVPLPAVIIGYKIPDYASDDHAALSILGSILGSGRSSRLDTKLVNNENPLCQDVGAGPWQLQDQGVFSINATMLQGKKIDDAEPILFATVQEIIDKGVTAEEVAKAKLQAKKSIVESRSEADDLAAQVGEEELFAGDASRVNAQTERLFAVTAEEVQQVARKYLARERSTTLRTLPDPLGAAARAAAAKEAKSVEAAAVATTAKVVEPRKVQFPADYPKQPPLAAGVASPDFAKGEEIDIHGVKVIVMPDHRLPLVTWSLTIRRGGHSEPEGKDGLAALTAGLVRRGAAGMDFQALNEDLESRAISIEVSDGGDFTRISGSAITDQLDHAMLRMKQMLFEPTLPADEFEKLKQQTLSGLKVSRENPSTVASIEMSEALYGRSPLGRSSTPESVAGITLEDVQAYHGMTYAWWDPVLIIAGDVTTEKGRQLAEELLSPWKGFVEQLPAMLRPAGPDYTLPAYDRKIVLIDNPNAKQSVIRVGTRGYDIRTDEKFAGSLAGQILSAGIESRLGKYVRAEKGYVYGIGAYFSPGRHGGSFGGSTETGFDTTAATVEAMFKVFNDLRADLVADDELADAKQRVAGGMLMETQTIQAQAGRRVDAILNDYPIDYWDKLPARVAQVSAEQVREVMRKYVVDDQMSIIVVAPAEKVKAQLEKFGRVEVLPMPSQRTAATQPALQEMLK